MNNCELAVLQWLETVVIDLNLCPFAKRELAKNTIRFIVSDAKSDADLLLDLFTELKRLDDDVHIQTTLLILPTALDDFDDYNQFLDLSDALIEQNAWQGVYQIASFHPHYQFADTATDSVENYTNRSPYPLLHILREASLEQALDLYKDPHLIPEKNIQCMHVQGLDVMQHKLAACTADQ